VHQAFAQKPELAHQAFVWEPTLAHQEFELEHFAREGLGSTPQQRSFRLEQLVLACWQLEFD
jgi:hypothetical protein